MTEPTGTVVPETPQEPATPAAPIPTEPLPPAAKRSLEDSLATLDEDTRKFVLDEVTKARKAAGDARVEAKTKAADEARAELAQTIGKALGLVKDDEKADPAKLTEQLTTANAVARQAAVELSVFRAAQTVGADAVALLDSRSFLAKLADVDPNDATAVGAAVQAAINENPTFKTGPQPRLPAPNPAQGAGGFGGAPNLDDQIAAAQKAGDVRLQISLQNQKLTAPAR